MFDLTITDVRIASNLQAGEKVITVVAGEWEAPNYENMSIEEILASDTSGPVYQVPTWEEVREEQAKAADLDKMLDLVERMNKGMSLIQGLYRDKAEISADYYSSKEEFFGLMAKLNFHKDRWNSLSVEEKRANYSKWQAWQSALWTKAKPANEKRKATGAKLGEINDTLNKYWNHYNLLKEQANELNMWGGYYALLNTEINTYWTKSQNATDLDTLDMCTAPTDEAIAFWKEERLANMADNHIMENAAYDEDVKVDWTYQDNRMKARVLIEDADFESLLTTSPF